MCRFLDIVVQKLTVDVPRCSVKLVTSTPSTEKFLLYRDYQSKVHGDDPNSITMESFSQFLSDSPLRREPTSVNILNTSLAYGTFHLEYRIDNVLVAVSVLDVLPHCLSSVYFFYRPHEDYLSWGTLSALIEIGLVRRISRHLPALHYYYLGLYLPSCPKLAYKAQYRPSEILDAETLEWRTIV